MIARSRTGLWLADEKQRAAGVNSQILFLLVCASTFLFAAWLRIYHIAQRSLWLDEAIAANISRGTLSQTLTLTRALHSAPVAHPYVLYLAERISTEPIAVRLPSLIASLLAVCVMFCFARVSSIDKKASLLSAIMLAVAASQIRYAQEVREYSLSVLLAALLTYFFLQATSAKEDQRRPVGLYVLLIVAPLVQYGLVLFSAGILASLFVTAFTKLHPWRWIWQAVTGAVFLGVGSVLSYLLTLRYQWGDKVWYLQGNYFAPGSGLLHFISSNSYYLLTFLLPGRSAALISLGAILLYLLFAGQNRVLPPILVLAFCSVGIVLICSLFRLYPYGAIRQCLYLAPVICLLASESLAQFANRFDGMWRAIAFGIIVSVVIFSGFRNIHSAQPYSEIEDIRSVVVRLQNQLGPGDQVYVYSGAVPGVSFYWKGDDGQLIYGDFHRDAPEKYLSELKASTRPSTKKLWIAFSHVYLNEDKTILQEFDSDWAIQPVITAKASALYEASPRSGPSHEISPVFAQGSTAKEATTIIASNVADSFFRWSIRNSTRPTQ